MSTDNGVYILETLEPAGPGFEYRVAHLQAVENYKWGLNSPSNDSDVHIENAREMWNSSPVFTSEQDAVYHAHQIYKDLDICEYGISSITIPRVF